jgi:hypothetical protein
LIRGSIHVRNNISGKFEFVSIFDIRISNLGAGTIFKNAKSEYRNPKQMPKKFEIRWAAEISSLRQAPFDARVPTRLHRCD